MNQLDFTFGNALLHFQKTGGPKGFLLKFALVFAAVTILLQVVNVWLQWPVYEIYLRMFTEGRDFDRYSDELFAASMRSNLTALLMLPLGVLVWMAFEGASQRRYMRGEGFRLRVGPDEWRLLVVGLIWIGLIIGAYIGLFLVILIPMLVGMAGGEAGVGIGAILGLLLTVAYLVFLLWAAARLSAAGALTVRDEQIRFFESWRVTKGKGWAIAGTWILLGLMVMILIIVIYAIAAALGFSTLVSRVPGLMEGDFEPSELVRALASPAFWLPMGLIALVLLFFQGAMQHVFAGPAALAAKTDPDWADTRAVDSTFS